MVNILFDTNNDGTWDAVAPGSYIAVWDGRTTRGELAPSGLYLYRLESRIGVFNRKLILIR